MPGVVGCGIITQIKFPMLIDGRKIAEKINRNTAAMVRKIKRLGLEPKIVAFLVGKRKESEIYVRQKERAAKRLGFIFEVFRLSEKTGAKKIMDELLAIQNDSATTGLIVQLPLPRKIDPNKILSCLLPDVDIDCLSDINLGRLILNNNIIEPPTAGAVMEILKYLGVTLPGKKVVVIGSGLLVGKPLVMILMNGGATVTVCNSRTKKLEGYCQEADIIISGAGQSNLLRPPMIKRGSVVIDAGFSFKGGAIFGDADVAGLNRKGVFVTPTPGGVGPVTVAKLMHNAAVCAERKVNS